MPWACLARCGPLSVRLHFPSQAPRLRPVHSCEVSPMSDLVLHDAGSCGLVTLSLDEHPLPPLHWPTGRRREGHLLRHSVPSAPRAESGVGVDWCHVHVSLLGAHIRYPWPWCGLTNLRTQLVVVAVRWHSCLGKPRRVEPSRFLRNRPCSQRQPGTTLNATVLPSPRSLCSSSRSGSLRCPPASWTLQSGTWHSCCPALLTASTFRTLCRPSGPPRLGICLVSCWGQHADCYDSTRERVLREGGQPGT